MAAETKSGTVLDRIIEARRAAIAHRKKSVPETALRFGVKHAKPLRDFAAALTHDSLNVIAELKKESIILHDSTTMAQAEAAAKGYSGGGERGLLEALLAEQMKLSAQGKVSLFAIAETEAKLGNADESLQYLTKCVWLHDENMVSLSQNQGFTRLHGNPAFEKLVAIVGVPPSS